MLRFRLCRCNFYFWRPLLNYLCLDLFEIWNLWCRLFILFNWLLVKLNLSALLLSRFYLLRTAVFLWTVNFISLSCSLVNWLPKIPWSKDRIAYLFNHFSHSRGSSPHKIDLLHDFILWVLLVSAIEARLIGGARIKICLPTLFCTICINTRFQSSDGIFLHKFLLIISHSLTIISLCLEDRRSKCGGKPNI